jgi:outer membrane protein OmpA-like peptidoglycan-associated protein
MAKPAILAILLFILAAGFLHAETIKERPYLFRYDGGAMGMQDQTFLICNDCQDDKPTMVPNLVAHTYAAPEPPKGERPGMDKNIRVNSTSLVRPDPDFEMVRFSFDSAELLPATIAVLNRIETGKGLDLKGFTCDVGKESYNLALSQKRADAVSSYLKKRGMTVLSSRGYGKSTAFPNRFLNRRVEIIENRENNGYEK